MKLIALALFSVVALHAQPSPTTYWKLQNGTLSPLNPSWIVNVPGGANGWTYSAGTITAANGSNVVIGTTFLVTATAAPTGGSVATAGTPGSTTICYKFALIYGSARSLPSAAGSAVCKTTSAATLNSTNYNVITAPSCAANQNVNIYVSTAGGNITHTGYLTSVACAATYNHQGLDGANDVLPSVDQTPGVYPLTGGLSSQLPLSPNSVGTSGTYIWTSPQFRGGSGATGFGMGSTWPNSGGPSIGFFDMTNPLLPAQGWEIGIDVNGMAVPGVGGCVSGCAGGLILAYEQGYGDVIGVKHLGQISIGSPDATGAAFEGQLTVKNRFAALPALWVGPNASQTGDVVQWRTLNGGANALKFDRYLHLYVGADDRLGGSTDPEFVVKNQGNAGASTIAILTGDGTAGSVGCYKIFSFNGTSKLASMCSDPSSGLFTLGVGSSFDDAMTINYTTRATAFTGAVGVASLASTAGITGTGIVVTANSAGLVAKTSTNNGGDVAEIRLEQSAGNILSCIKSDASSGLMTIGTGNACTSALTFAFSGQAATFSSTVQAAGYKSSDGTAGATVSACTAFKNGLCVSGT